MIAHFPVRWLHQIELTSRCNLRCKYCASPTLKRPKLDMTEAHFERALAIARVCHVRYDQSEINMAGIGESTLHPDFVRHMHRAREVLGASIKIVLATNGLLMTRELAYAIKDMRPTVFVSLHRPERAGPAVEALRSAGIFAGSSSDPSLAATDWAGQVKWHRSAGVARKCPWVIGQKVMAMADGRLTRCSFDASGIGVIGTLDDDFFSLETSPYELCVTCDQDVGVSIDELRTTHAARAARDRVVDADSIKQRDLSKAAWPAHWPVGEVLGMSSLGSPRHSALPARPRADEEIT